MSAFDRLSACAGSWRGTNRLQDPHTNAADESPSSLVVNPVLGGRFVRLDYTWAYHGKPQEGSLLVGRDAKPGEVTAHWIDSWHMGDTVMACRGAAVDNGALSVRGSYAAPPGPDWGWRTTITPDGGDALRVVMYNVTPDAQEQLAVEASYTRA